MKCKITRHKWEKSGIHGLHRLRVKKDGLCTPSARGAAGCQPRTRGLVAPLPLTPPSKNPESRIKTEGKIILTKDYTPYFVNISKGKRRMGPLLSFSLSPGFLLFLSTGHRGEVAAGNFGNSPSLALCASPPCTKQPRRRQRVTQSQALLLRVMVPENRRRRPPPWGVLH